MTENQKYFYSKILLFGEYTVTVGSGALAVPLHIYKGRWQNDNNTQKVNPGLHHLLYHIKNNDFLVECLHVGKLEADISAGLNFESNIPIGYGLGSSGALVAALYDAYANNKTTDLIALKSIFSLIESVFHGSSSGLDPLVSYLNQAIIIGEDHHLTTSNLTIANKGFFLIDSGISRQTLPLVATFNAKMKQNTDFQNIVAELSKINQDAIQAIMSKACHQSLIQQISAIQLAHFKEMIPENFHELWSKGLESGHYFLKLCGAGGGGMILGWSTDTDTIKSQLKNYELIII